MELGADGAAAADEALAADIANEELLRRDHVVNENVYLDRISASRTFIALTREVVCHTCSQHVADV